MSSFGISLALVTLQRLRHSTTKHLTMISKSDISADMKITDPFIRFAQHVIVTDTCWIWTGAKGCDFGYGQFRTHDKKRIQAHRYSYEIFKGDIPKELQLDHICRIPMCVNPRHLEAVTAQENRLRGMYISSCMHKERSRIHCKECTDNHRRQYVKEWRESKEYQEARFQKQKEKLLKKALLHEMVRAIPRKIILRTKKPKLQPVRLQNNAVWDRLSGSWKLKEVAV